MSERMRLAVKAEFERYRMIHDQIVSVAVPDPDLWDWYYAIDCRGYVAVGSLLFDGENPSALCMGDVLFRAKEGWTNSDYGERLIVGKVPRWEGT